METQTAESGKEYEERNRRCYYETLKADWVKKKISMKTLTDQMYGGVREAGKYPEEYHKFYYYIMGIVESDANVENMYVVLFSLAATIFTVWKNCLSAWGNMSPQLQIIDGVLWSIASLAFLMLILAPRIWALFHSRERIFYKILYRMLQDNLPSKEEHDFDSKE